MNVVGWSMMMICMAPCARNKSLQTNQELQHIKVYWHVKFSIGFDTILTKNMVINPLPKANLAVWV